MTTTVQRRGSAGPIDTDDLTRALTAYLNDRRDVGTDVPVPAPEPDPEPGERWLPILAAVLPALVQAVPAIINAFRDGNRDLDVFDEGRDHTERDLGAVLGVLLPHLLDVLPQLVDALGGDRDLPRDAGEVTDRFFKPLLDVLVPMCTIAAPPIVAALISRARDTEVLPASSPEFAQRFLGPLLGVLVPALAQTLPQLIAAVTGRPRGTQLNWVNFTGQWLPDGDTMSMDEWDIEPGFIEIELTQPYGTWGKALRLMIGGTQVDRVEVRDENRTSRTMRIPVEQVRGAGYIEFVKAKMFGRMTGMYQLGGLEQKDGKHLRFNWLNS